MKKVVVLMSTYNGDKYIKEQIDSVLNQQGVTIKLIVRDDGSIDGTTKILNQYAQEGKLTWYMGENLKPLGSFMHLLLNQGDMDYYAFCDQDDVWLPNKIQESLVVMQKNEECNSNTPILVHTDMSVVDSNLNIINKSFWDCNGIRPDILNNFNNLACYNGVNGCTILMNKKAKELVCVKYFQQNQFIHDVMCALLISANGGIIDYVDKPLVLYRQHERNVVGADKVEKFRYFKRLRQLVPILRNNYKNYVTVNRIKKISLISYIYYKIRYILTKKHGIRK